MLSEVLKTHTKHPHQELESAIISRIKKLNSTSEYVSLLKIFYGYVAALENRLNALVPSNLISDYYQRRKANQILDDISFFEPKTTSATLAANLPVINTPGQAIGVMYVLEGSTLGGKYITRMIADKLNLESTGGFSFFNGYKERTEVMWANFKEVLNSGVLATESEKDICDAANQTFIKFKQWIDEH
jgi:heme oxygenase (biliverdin-IX-beta and delta-forming)